LKVAHSLTVTGVYLAIRKIIFRCLQIFVGAPPELVHLLQQSIHCTTSFMKQYRQRHHQLSPQLRRSSTAAAITIDARHSLSPPPPSSSAKSKRATPTSATTTLASSTHHETMTPTLTANNKPSYVLCDIYLVGSSSQCRRGRRA
jgi:hypothetical protein